MSVAKCEEKATIHQILNHLRAAQGIIKGVLADVKIKI